jgi:putative nucleotidyltransferase with HDIG domain
MSTGTPSTFEIGATASPAALAPPLTITLMNPQAHERRHDSAITVLEDELLGAERNALAEALAAALDTREHETGEHSKRVACHTLVLARRLTNDRERLRQIYWGSLLHDLGKIGVPDAVLLKPGPLTADEQALMRTHPEQGYAILKEVPFMQEAAQIVLAHEERFDGRGYPRGLAGEAIPLGARIFAVIDTLDAMTSDRPYRRGLPFDAAKAEIIALSGKQFDPAAVETFLAEENILREMVAIKCQTDPPIDHSRR